MFTKLNILNNVTFMHKINTQTAPTVFLPKFHKPCHLYPTRFSKFNYLKPDHKLSKCKYRISIRGPSLWNDYLTDTEKQIEIVSVFRKIVKTRLLSSENETKYF